MMDLHDVIIVGGGLVGGLTALLLEREGVQVTLLDAAPLLDEAAALATLHPRVLALNPATIHLLKIVEVWPEISRMMPYTGMHVWNKNGYGEIEFGVSSEHFPATENILGYMVEPNLLNLAIQKRILQRINDYRTKIKIVHLEQNSKGWSIKLDNGEKLNTKLLIGADGARSFVREQALIGLDVLDYHQTALSCAIKTERPHNYTARQIFLPTGPLAYLPMASLIEDDSTYWQSIVWTLPDDYAEEYSKLNDHEFKQLLTRESQYMLGKVVEVGSRVTFPLKACSAQHYIKKGLVLVGDAAHVIHPLAGQGVNIGCADAAVLADALLHDFKRGLWAQEQTLRRYEHKRRSQNTMLMHSMSAIGWIESHQFSPLIFLRNFALRSINSTQVLKDAFMHQASGLPALKNTRYSL